MEVHNASTQYVAAPDNGVGDESLSSALQSIQNFTVQRIEIVFDLFFLPVVSKVHRDVAEGCYAQFLGYEFQLPVKADGLSHCPRQADIFADHLAIARGSDL